MRLNQTVSKGKGSHRQATESKMAPTPTVRGPPMKTKLYICYIRVGGPGPALICYLVGTTAILTQESI